MTTFTEYDWQLHRDSFASIGKTFRGEIYENCARFKLVGKAYEAMPREQDGHFQIESARHLAGPLRALRDPNVRMVFIIGATQVLKSVVGDIWIPYLLEHFLSSILVLFETDPKALLYCDTRLMDTIKAHPVLSKLFNDIPRHDLTKTEIKLGGAKLLVGGLNDSNVSSLSWKYIWISEAWQHGVDGLLRKAIKRADRFPNDCKVLIESQAGDAGEDLHKETKTAHQVPLTWACPKCGGRQTWEFAHLRPDDFKPIAGEAKPGTYSGMQFAAEGDIAERARTSEWECHWCGYRIKDTQFNRKAIAETYEQDYQIVGPDGLKYSPRSVCFVIPREAAIGNTFESSSANFLTAKESEQSCNNKPMADWYKSERAVFYDPKLLRATSKALIGSHSIEGTIPDEAARIMMVDCQQDPDQSEALKKSIIGHFWYVAWAIDKSGKNIYQLARGYARSWKEWMDVRKALKIPNKNVAIDGGNWLDEVLDYAAANWEEGFNYTARGKPFKALTTWVVLRGNGTRKSFKHEDGISRVFAQPSYYQRFIKIGTTQRAINIPVIEWSNLSIKDQLFAIRQGGEGKPMLHILPREKLDAATQEKERGPLTYQQQISNEYRTTVNGRPKWEESNPNVHYNDCDCQGIVTFGRGGYIGHVEVSEDEAQVV